jgi:hypothetical protein
MLEEKLEMQTLAKIVVMAGVLVSATSVSAGHFEDGNSLLDHCRGHTYTEKMLCIGYIEGAFDMFQQWRIQLDKDSCPTGIIEKQVEDTVISALTRHPAGRNDNAALIILSAILNEWHCDF